MRMRSPTGTPSPRLGFGSPSAARSRPGNSSSTTRTVGVVGGRARSCRGAAGWCSSRRSISATRSSSSTAWAAMSRGAGDLVGPVGGAVPGAAEQQAGDVGAGDEDVGGGGELGEQPVGERGLPGAVLPCTARWAGSVMAWPRVVPSSVRPRITDSAPEADGDGREAEAVAQRVGVEQDAAAPSGRRSARPAGRGRRGCARGGRRSPCGEVGRLLAGHQLDGERGAAGRGGPPRPAGCGR